MSVNADNKDKKELQKLPEVFCLEQDDLLN